ncbi:MAG: MerR family transcriptional regulator [Dehalococcoidia bacterium]
MADIYMRIGELSERSGVPAETIRAWERRYRAFQPSRTSGGFRLYTEADLAAVVRMRDSVAAGVRAAEAARRLAAAAEGVTSPGPAGEMARAAFHLALRRLDDGQIQVAFDRLLAVFDLDTVAGEVLIGELQAMGEEWAAGALSVAQEHFAVSVLRGRLLGLARGWDSGFGPRAVLACPPGELHDISLLLFGLLLRRRGWRITFLGADTPYAQIVEAGEGVGADLVVVASPFAARLEEGAPGLTGLATRFRLLLAGAGASAAFADTVGADVAVGSLALAADAATEAMRERLDRRQDDVGRRPARDATPPEN